MKGLIVNTIVHQSDENCDFFLKKRFFHFITGSSLNISIKLAPLAHANTVQCYYFNIHSKQRDSTWRNKEFW